MRVENYGDPVYAPNSVGGPAADPARFGEDHTSWNVGELQRSAYTPHAEDDDFVQPRALVETVLGDDERAALASNIIGHASAAEVTTEMRARVVEYWRNVSVDLGAEIEKGLSNGSKPGHEPV